MIYNYNRKLNPLAKNLRKNMTPEEKHLWYDFLKLLPITVNRQKIIGNYIVDFFIASKRIVIEVDGSQHASPMYRGADENRDAYLQSLGITVLRYSNVDVQKNFSTVCENILLYAGLKANDVKNFRK